MLDTISVCSQPNNLTSTMFILVLFNHRLNKVVYHKCYAIFGDGYCLFADESGT